MRAQTHQTELSSRLFGFTLPRAVVFALFPPPYWASSGASPVGGSGAAVVVIHCDRLDFEAQRALDGSLNNRERHWERSPSESF